MNVSRAQRIRDTVEENAMNRTVAALIGLAAVAGAQTATAETLKVAVAQRGFWNSTFIDVGLKQGYFKEVGLDTTFSIPKAAPRRSPR